MRKLKRAIIISHEDDIKFLEKHPEYDHNFDLICEHEFLKETHTKLNLAKPLNNYFKNDGKSKEVSEIVYLIKNWFRDDFGKDIRETEGVSIGPIMGQMALVAFSNFYRSYIALSNLLEEYQDVLVSTNVDFSFKVSVELLKGRASFFNPKHSSQYAQRSTAREGRSSLYPNEHKFSLVARIIQKPFIYFARKRKHLNLYDWTTKDLASRKDVLIQNSFIPWKGYYFLKKKKYWREAARIFPATLSHEFINEGLIESALKRKSIFWDTSLIKGCTKIFRHYYEKTRLVFMHSYCLYMDILANYRPKLLTLPGEAHYAYVIATQIATRMNIKTALIVDGYPFWWNPHAFYKDSGGENFIFDYFAGFGSGGVDYLKSLGIPDKKIFNLSPPLLNGLDNVEKKNHRKKALILFPYPRNGNPQCFWDRRRSSVKDIYDVVIKSSYEKVGIKMKPGSSMDNVEDIMALRETFKREIADGKVEIETGLMRDCLAEYDVAIGGLSTALFEAQILGVQFYVFEPVYHGVTDREIENAQFYTEKEVARNPQELEENLKNEQYVKINKERLTGGENIRSFPFESLF